jgi:hypothetical protein
MLAGAPDWVGSLSGRSRRWAHSRVSSHAPGFSILMT